MSGWRDAVISGAMAGPALVGQMDVSALSEAAGLSSPVEQSASVLIENVGLAVGEAVQGRSDGEEAVGAEPIQESEYGEYRDAETLADADDGFEFEPVDGSDVADSISVTDSTEGGDASDGGWT